MINESYQILDRELLSDCIWIGTYAIAIQRDTKINIIYDLVSFHGIKGWVNPGNLVKKKQLDGNDAYGLIWSVAAWGHEFFKKNRKAESNKLSNERLSRINILLSKIKTPLDWVLIFLSATGGAFPDDKYYTQVGIHDLFEQLGLKDEQSPDKFRILTHEELDQAMAILFVDPTLDCPAVPVIFGRKNSIIELTAALSESNGKSVLLLARPGWGKTYLAQAVAAIICSKRDQSGSEFYGVRIVNITSESRVFDPYKLDVTDSVQNTSAIFDKLIGALNLDDLRTKQVNIQVKGLVKFFQENAALIIIDNLETVQDVNILLTQLSEIAEASNSGKKIRVRFLLVSRPIRDIDALIARRSIEKAIDLSNLDNDSSGDMFRHLIQATANPGYVKNYMLAQVDTLIPYVNGVPLLIKLAVAWLSHQYSIPDIIKSMVDGDDEQLMNFFYKESWHHFTPEAKAVFYTATLTMDPLGFAYNDLLEKSNLPKDVFRQVYHSEVYPSLYFETIFSDGTPKFVMHSLTRAFIRRQSENEKTEASS